MAKARAIVKRRKSVQNIRKITRTMELIATARFKKALDRATEAEAYTRKIAELVADLGSTARRSLAPAAREARRRSSGRCCSCSPATAAWPAAITATSLRLATRHAPGLSRPTASTRLAGGRRQARDQLLQVPRHPGRRHLHPVRGPAPVRRGRDAGRTSTSACFVKGEIDRLDVVYTQFINGRAAGSGRPDAPADDRGAGRRRRARRSARRSRPRGRGRSPEGRARALRVRPRPAEHPRGDRPGLVQGPPLQVLPRRGRQRADRPDGRHAGSDRERRRHDQDARHGFTTAPDRRRSPASSPRSSAAPRGLE